MNNKLNFNEVISTSLSDYKKNWKPLNLYVFCFLIISLAIFTLIFVLTLVLGGATILGSITTTTGNVDTNRIGSIIAGALGLFAGLVVVSYGLISIFIINLYDSVLKLLTGKEVNYFSFNKNYLRIILTSLLQIVIILAGCLLLFLPGIYLAIRLYPMMLIAINEELSPVEAMNKAFRITKGNFWNIVLSVLLPAIIYNIISFTIVGLLDTAKQVNLSLLAFFVIYLLYAGFEVILSLNVYRTLNSSNETEDGEIVENNIAQSI